jgi:hypothetical protein
MLAGYVWLGLAGVILFAHPPGTNSFGYDVALHAVLIGFAVPMVFGHALVMGPTVASIKLRYVPILTGPSPPAPFDRPPGWIRHHGVGGRTLG